MSEQILFALMRSYDSYKIHNVSSKEVKFMEFESVFEELDGAYAPNTLINYRKDLGRMCQWIRAHGVQPEKMTHEELILYLENECTEYRMATIRRAVAAIGTIYKYAELPDPTRHPKVTLALRRIARQRGSLQSQAKPLTRELFEQLLILCDPPSDDRLKKPGATHTRSRDDAPPQ